MFCRKGTSAEQTFYKGCDCSSLSHGKTQFPIKPFPQVLQDDMKKAETIGEK